MPQMLTDEELGRECERIVGERPMVTWTSEAKGSSDEEITEAIIANQKFSEAQNRLRQTRIGEQIRLLCLKSQ